MCSWFSSVFYGFKSHVNLILFNLTFVCGCKKAIQLHFFARGNSIVLLLFIEK